MRVQGRETCPKTYRLCDWLERSGQVFEYEEVGTRVEYVPILSYADQVIPNATPRDAAGVLGLRHPQRAAYDVIVVGAGPAGLSAALHCAVEGLKVLSVEANAWGGQMSSSMLVRNYAGYPRGVDGVTLTMKMVEQAKLEGAELVTQREATRLERFNGGWLVTLDAVVTVYAKAVIIATGATFKVADADGHEQYLHAGVHLGMTSFDMTRCGTDVTIIGGGNAAGQAALAFENQGKNVTVITRGASLRDSMSAYLVDELEASGVEVVTGSEVQAVQGDGERVSSITLRGGKELACSSVYMFAGTNPASEWAGEHVQRSKKGFIPALDTAVNLHGLFAVGDVRLGSKKRVSVAAGEGAVAAAKAWEYVNRGV